MTYINPDPEIRRALLLVKQAKEEVQRHNQLKEAASERGDHHAWLRHLEMERAWLERESQRKHEVTELLCNKAVAL